MTPRTISEKTFDVDVKIRVVAMNKPAAIDKVRDILNQVMKVEDGLDYFILE